jgi:hypothetical protein
MRVGLPSDAAASRRVAARAYDQTAGPGGLVWVLGRKLRALDPTWARFFAA